MSVILDFVLADLGKATSQCHHIHSAIPYRRFMLRDNRFSSYLDNRLSRTKYVYRVVIIRACPRLGGLLVGFFCLIALSNVVWLRPCFLSLGVRRHW